MSIHEQRWEGDGQDPLATPGGRWDRQVQVREVNGGKAAPEVVPWEGEETVRTAALRATPTSQGALRRPR